MGFWSKTFTWWNGATWGTALCTRRFGSEVGRDDAGNVYYQDKKRPARRWVIYDGANDGSRVPPGWQAWLRGTIDDLPDKALPPRPQVPAAADREPDRDDGRLPARRRAWQRAGSGRPRPATTSPGSPNKREQPSPHRCCLRWRSRRAAAASASRNTSHRPAKTARPRGGRPGRA